MSYADQQYHELLQNLVMLAKNQQAVENRTDTDAYTLFGYQMRFDLTKGFPLLTTKKVHFKAIVTELLWFLKGDTNIRYLLEHGCHIWTDWRLKEFNAKRKEWGKREVSAQEFETCILTDDDFAKEWGDIGKGYGHQWRNFGELPELRPYSKDVKYQEGFDQISWVINEIKTNPKSRRLIVSGWNPHEADKVDLPPCHTLFQFHVQPMSLIERKRWVDSNYVGGGPQAIADYCNTGNPEVDQERRKQNRESNFSDVCDWSGAPKAKLSCQLYQRSADTFLGVPFNIASYALLTQMVAQVCGLALGEFVWTGGNVHLYENHLNQAKEQLANSMYMHEAAIVKINTAGKTIFDITHDDIELVGYKSYPAIKGDVAV